MPRLGGFGPLVSAGVVLGLAVGAFFDGILFHQVLQWHHMLSSHPDPAVARNTGLNVLFDGLFHATAWILALAGIALLARAARRADVPWSGRVLAGSMLAGAGLFNLVEGVVDHHVLGLHHVHPSGAFVWDVAFLAFGAFLVLAGAFLARTDDRFAAATRARGAVVRRA